jgi:thiamine biosynthesis lipoprotein
VIRKFLSLSFEGRYSVLRLAFFLFFLLTPVFSQDFGQSEAKLIEVTREIHLMGTQCRIDTYAHDRQSGILKLETLLEILEAEERKLSTWRSDSVLSRLNQHPINLPFVLDRHLFSLFSDLSFWSFATQAAFDPTIGVLVEAWGLREGGRHPSDISLKKALGKIGMQYIELDARQSQVVRRRPVKIDAGAFGKGEALDRLLRSSLELNYDNWLVDLGGQVMVHGLPPGQDAWTISLAHPLNRQESVLCLKLVTGTLATSGSSEKDLKFRENRIGHILDPRTGFPAAYQGSVTVWHSRGLVADLLSTALYVMGLKKGLQWAESQNVAACYMSTADNSDLEIKATSAFKRRFFK